MAMGSLNDLSKKLQKITNNARALNGKHSVPLGELMPPSFVSRHTRFENIDALFDAGGFKADTADEFAAIPDDKLGEFIKANSKFSSWEEMLGEAGKAFTIKKLGL